MLSADNGSMHSWVAGHGRPVALAAASFGLMFCAAVSAAEPPVTVDYQSSLTGYRRFDAQVSSVAWRQANDAIGSGNEGAARGMQGPTEPAPADTTGAQRTTAGEHREHRQ